jgi:hypothetical protein
VKHQIGKKINKKRKKKKKKAQAHEPWATHELAPYFEIFFFIIMGRMTCRVMGVEFEQI